ncbi:MAG TPA: ABC transporter ATP-binding protein [Gordonia sp. (in: high G+C Gram-positive bacteria)]|uniref:ABC transporter ATP-binding protein n=1 Tax=Gordonia sp. (in: high G+C Gram-positive bacteria) TaxID=84139 RepID=UPI0025C44E0C|nr:MULTISPECIES: ABC transporter ATP-binding protein [unclassified Gordonia (in: high G+C Gram-positive bacteria)]HNP55995.1 ABC transporter ATP-binding protein [Gordonia sp. (in: high G+C Gram-positive bacteria)]HRC51860.1 ABC transporter ATP-binding protein [Gordonia sp. (in: high G+C Gram-positive bacteria)]
MPRPDPSPDEQAAVDITGLRKSFGAHTAVDGLDLRLRRGTVLALLGPNGAGKTTTVEICEGFTAPDAGQVRVLGLDPRDDNDALRARIGVMLQGGGAYPGARAAEMLRLCAAYSANPIDPDWLLDVLGLTPVADTPFRRLSGGQQQRLSLACALVGRPELVFLDEPTAGLDAHARLLVWDLIAALRTDGVSVLLTTHMLDEAEHLADDIVIIDAGRVVAAGTPAELTARDHAGLRFTAVGDLDITAAAAAVSAACGGATTTGTRGEDGGYTLIGPATPEAIAALAAWCAESGVLITELHAAGASLQDVFLSLTGREVRA